MGLNTTTGLLLAGGAVAAEATGVINISAFGAGQTEDGGGNTGSIGGIPKIELPSFQAPSFSAPEFSFDPSFNPDNPAMQPNSPVFDFNPSNDNGSFPIIPGNDEGSGKKNKKKNNNNQDSSIGIPFTDQRIGDGEGNDSGIAGDGIGAETGRDTGNAGAGAVAGVFEGIYNKSKDVGSQLPGADINKAKALDNAAGDTDEAVSRTFDDKEGGGVIDGAKETLGINGNNKNKKKNKDNGVSVSVSDKVTVENNSGSSKNKSSNKSKKKDGNQFGEGKISNGDFFKGDLF